MNDKHECENSNIHCFDCKAVICRECMVIDLQNLRCKQCAESATRGPGKPSAKVGSFAPKGPSNLEKRARGETKASFSLAVATTFYSFVLFKFLNMLTFCVTWLSQTVLVAGLLGLGLSSLLLRHLVNSATKRALLLIVPCILLGVALVDVMEWALSPVNHRAYPNLIQALMVFLVLLAVILRLKNRHAPGS